MSLVTKSAASKIGIVLLVFSVLVGSLAFAFNYVDGVLRNRAYSAAGIRGVLGLGLDNNDTTRVIALDQDGNLLLKPHGVDVSSGDLGYSYIDKFGANTDLDSASEEDVWDGGCEMGDVGCEMGDGGFVNCLKP